MSWMKTATLPVLLLIMQSSVNPLITLHLRSSSVNGDDWPHGRLPYVKLLKQCLAHRKDYIFAITVIKC